MKRALVYCVLALLLSIVAFMCWAYPGYDKIEFSTDLWQSSEAKVRGHMVHNLLDTHELEGMTVKELFQLLGEPDTGELAGEWDTPFGMSPSLQEFRDNYEYLHEADFILIEYHLGLMGARENAGMALNYNLCCYIEGGVIASVSVED